MNLFFDRQLISIIKIYISHRPLHYSLCNHDIANLISNAEILFVNKDVLTVFVHRHMQRILMILKPSSAHLLLKIPIVKYRFTSVHKA